MLQITLITTLICAIPLLMGCKTFDGSVNGGKYIDASGETWIMVEGKQLELHVPYVSKAGIRGVDKRSAAYTVWPDGRILPLWERSEEYLRGIGRHDIFLDGEKIVITSPEGERVDLVRQSP